MLKKAGVWLFLIAGMPLVACCSTTPQRQPRPVQTQAQQPAPVVVQPNTSDEEAERMRQQILDKQAALARAEADRRALEEELNQALASKKSPTKKEQDSYLK